jgi:hypothetical protein
VNDKLWNPYQTKEGVVTSIMVNDNLFDILINPGGKAGDPVMLDTRPKTQFFSIDNQATTSAAGGQPPSLRPSEQTTAWSSPVSFPWARHSRPSPSSHPTRPRTRGRCSLRRCAAPVSP